MTTYTDIILQDTNGNFFVPYGFIERLGDVQITNPTNGQALLYDAQSGKWINGTVSGGGTITVDQTYDPTSTNAQSGTAVAEALTKSVIFRKWSSS